MNTLKIKGITGVPLFVSGIQGYIDGKCGAIALINNEWQGHYIENKKASYRYFVHALYSKLEEQTAPLHIESTSLVVEYANNNEKLMKPIETTSGSASAIQARTMKRLSSEKDRLLMRQQEIVLRLSAIDEEITHATSDAVSKHRQATALTVRRVQAYLHGASNAAHKAQADTKVNIQHTTSEEDEFNSRHAINGVLRRAIIENTLKEVTRK